MLGVIHTFPDGRRCYLANRKIEDIHTAGQKTISDAVRIGKASWGIEDEILIHMRAHGVQYAGVKVLNNGDTYLTRLEDFFDRIKASTVEPARRSRSRTLYRHLPLQHFQRRPGKIRV